MNKRILISLVFLILGSTLAAQKTQLWLTYGQSRFLYAPGIEGTFLFTGRFGIQVGVSSFVQSYPPEQVAKVTEKGSFNFYNANVGLSGYLFRINNHRWGATAGFKVYYGPEFELLHYYRAGGYAVYFDDSQLRPSYGIDMGFYYSYRWFTVVLKYDTARGKIRMGIGDWF